MDQNYRMYQQAFNSIENKVANHGDIIQPFNERLITDGVCPTLTTRPEGFKTAILVVEKTVGGCVDCDECEHRSEECLCDISENEDECPLLR